MLVQTVPELRKQQPAKEALERIQDSLKQTPARIFGYRALAVEDLEVSLTGQDLDNIQLSNLLKPL